MFLVTPDLCFTFIFVLGGPGLPGDDLAALRGPDPAMRPLPGVGEAAVAGEEEGEEEVGETEMILSPTR